MVNGSGTFDIAVFGGVNLLDVFFLFARKLFTTLTMIRLSDILVLTLTLLLFLIMYLYGPRAPFLSFRRTGLRTGISYMLVGLQ
jgi:hypothetical protein